MTRSRLVLFMEGYGKIEKILKGKYKPSHLRGHEISFPPFKFNPHITIMAVVGIDFGTLHSKVKYTSHAPMDSTDSQRHRSVLPDIEASISSPTRSQIALHRMILFYFHFRGSLGSLTIHTDPLLHSVPNSAPSENLQRPKRHPISRTPSDPLTVSSEERFRTRKSQNLSKNSSMRSWWMSMELWALRYAVDLSRCAKIDCGFRSTIGARSKNTRRPN